MFLAVFIIWPLLEALLTPDAATWRSLSESARWRSATLNTLWLTALSGGSAVVLGLLYALAVTKFRIPGWRFFGWEPLLGLFLPPFVGALALLLLIRSHGHITSQLHGLVVSIHALHDI